MDISITPKTRKLLKRQMDTGLFTRPDEVFRLALETLEQIKEGNYDDLDPETRAVIEQGEAEFQRGDFQLWSKVRSKLRKRFVK